MMLPEAKLDIVLRVADGAVAEVLILSSRLVQASNLFAGRHPDEVLALLPTVFSLCGTAQAVAGLTAMESAAGVIVPAPQVGARRLMVLAETVAEHGLAVARDWPALIGIPQDLAAARLIKAAMAGIRPALYPDGDWRMLGGGRLAPDRGALATAITTAEDAVARLDAIATTVLARVATHGASGFGNALFLPIPQDGPPDLAARLAADTGDYVARPDSSGRVFETGPLARQHRHPRIAGLMGEYGTGLRPRLAARMVDTAEALREMVRLVQDLNGSLPDNGAGIGLVEAARGQLAHRVELENGRVKRYQILAPTEWNFHPHGPLARGLGNIAATADLEDRTRLLVNALDPCVACTIRVEQADA